MPTDYQINLSKGLTSSAEERRRFYNGMLFYLAGSAAVLVFAGYISSVNIRAGLEARYQQRNLVKAMTSVSEFSKSFYKNPEKTYERMGLYLEDLELIQDALEERSHFLPVIGLLFSNFPEDVALQDLNASEVSGKIKFALLLPLSDANGGDPARKLQSDWSSNRELMARVSSIRSVTSERRMMGEYPVSFVEFECVLK